MRGAVAIALLLATTHASAQPAPCDACTRGEAIIDKYGLQPLRPLAASLATLPLDEPMTPEQYARVIEIRQRTPALVRLGALDDADFALVATALCRANHDVDACVMTTTRALRCIGDRCAVALPTPDGRDVDLTELPPPCERRVNRKRSPRVGLGFDWGTGWLRSEHPAEGRAWSLAIDARYRFTPRIGAVARIDRSAGRDETTDADGDGKDDLSTGSIVRVSALAGPSIMFALEPWEGTTRFLRLDVLGGYVATRSPADENGPVAGFDLAHHIGVFRTGVRVVQGFGDASDATLAVVHLGFVVGAGPEYKYETGCDPEELERSSRLALGFDYPFGGYGFSSQLGLIATGLGLEAIWNLNRRFDAVTRVDLLVFPGYERDRTIHQAMLAGLRMDHGTPGDRSSRNGWFSTVLGGYSHGSGFTPTTTGSGPVLDLGLGWGRQSKEVGGFFRLHARFGVAPDNSDYRAVFITGGFELRFDPKRWRDRV